MKLTKNLKTLSIALSVLATLYAPIPSSADEGVVSIATSFVAGVAVSGVGGGVVASVLGGAIGFSLLGSMANNYAYEGLDNEILAKAAGEDVQNSQLNAFLEAARHSEALQEHFPSIDLDEISDTDLAKLLLEPLNE